MIRSSRSKLGLQVGFELGSKLGPKVGSKVGPEVGSKVGPKVGRIAMVWFIGALLFSTAVQGSYLVQHCCADMRVSNGLGHY